MENQPQPNTLETEPTLSVHPVHPENKQLQTQAGEQEIADHFSRSFKGGQMTCRINQHKSCIKLNLLFCEKEHQPENIHELFPQKEDNKEIKVVISRKTIDPDLKTLFPNMADLHRFFANYAGNAQSIEIDRQQIKIRKNDKEVIINFQQLQALEIANNKVRINLDNMEDKLLQFSPKEWSILDKAGQLFNEKDIENENEKTIEVQQIISGSTKSSDIRQIKAYLFSKEGKELFCSFELDEQESGMDEETQQLVSRMEKKALQFEQKHRNILNKLLHLPLYQQIHNKEAIAKAKKFSLPGTKPTTIFPQGYTPPHLQKKMKPDDFSPQQYWKFGAAQTKKEQLKMSKQMLKMGYSADEVIRRLEQIERSKKGGNNNPAEVYKAPSQGPVRPFHIQPQPSVSTPKERKMKVGDDRQIRTRLIQLLREKRYKSLEQIHKHMERQGLRTTIQVLRDIVDEIKALNAERKRKQNQGKV